MAGCTPQVERAATDAVGSILPECPAFAGILSTVEQGDGGQAIESESGLTCLPCLLTRTPSSEHPVKPIDKKPVWLLTQKDGLKLVSEKIDGDTQEAVSLPVWVEQNVTTRQPAGFFETILRPGPPPPPPQHVAPTGFGASHLPPPPRDAAPTDFGLAACPPPPTIAPSVEAAPTSKQLSVSTVQTDDGPCHHITWTIPNVKKKKHGFDIKDQQMHSQLFEIEMLENGELRPTKFRIQISPVARNTSKGGGSFKSATEGKISLNRVDTASGTLSECKVKMSCICSPKDVEPKAVLHDFTQHNKCDPEKEGHFSLMEAKQLDTFTVEVAISPSTYDL